MQFEKIVSDRTLKSKQKGSMLSKLILDQPDILPEMIEYGSTASDSDVAVILEAMEYASTDHASILTGEALDFAISHLSAGVSRVKREAARVVGNVIHRYPEKAEAAAPSLLTNCDDDGTVVRWVTAYALGEVLGLRLPLNRELVPQIQAILEREQKNSIQKIYRKALKEIDA